jgi:predicted nucleic acid-binding protein
LNYTIDASVFVAATREQEKNFAISRELVDRFEHQSNQSLDVYCPTLILPECAAAIARSSSSRKTAEEIVTLLQNMEGLRLVGLDATLGTRAARIAIEQKLRGADAVYLTVAQAFDATLITWDSEMLERGAKVVQTMTPAQWLEQAKTSEENESK